MYWEYDIPLLLEPVLAKRHVCGWVAVRLSAAGAVVVGQGKRDRIRLPGRGLSSMSEPWMGSKKDKRRKERSRREGSSKQKNGSSVLLMPDRKTLSQGCRRMLKQKGSCVRRKNGQ